MNRHLELASRTLASCRNDLRNCMWDLRNQTLDDVTMDDAIRRTLAPHLAGASLSVRFEVDRELFSDTTALAILRIIRELTVNAVLHGRATAIKVAGCIENGRLMFSVADNGCGFDPDSAPGVEQGHFGLQGVAERAERLNGELMIRSTPYKGTKAQVSIIINRKQNIRS
jgi:signal transduction histidine kinase